MLTYTVWKSLIDEFNVYTTKSTKMGVYSFLSFMSIFTIILDILTFPFQLIGIIIYLITNRKR